MADGLQGAIDAVARTDPGLVREHNEDALACDPARGLMILADGMGGYNAGEVASGMAVSFLASALDTSFFDPALQSAAADGPDGMGETAATTSARRCLAECIRQANTAIFHAAQSEAQCAGMGTTLVMAIFIDNRIVVAHIGDSRLYRLRDGALSRVTRDHSLLQEQIDCGMITPQEARFALNKNLVTRALGVDVEVEPEIRDYAVQPGDLYLLCSDGLNDMLPDEEIELVLQSLSANLELAAEQLVQMANDCGGRDNVSVILAKVVRDFSA